MSPCCGQEEAKPENKPRGCTDILCLFIFGLFWGLLIFISAFAFVIGNPRRLAYGQDSYGNTCGTKNEELGNMTFSGMDLTDRPYLFFLNNSDFNNSLKICVKKCPNKNLLNEKDIREFETATGSHLCRYDIPNFKDRSALYPELENRTVDQYFLYVEEKSGHHACPVPPVLASKSLLNRCVPLSISKLKNDIMASIYAYLNSFDIIHQAVSDIYAARYEIMGMIGLSVVLSFLMAFTIHFLASIVAWIIMIVASIACIAATCILWWVFVDIKWQLDSTPFTQLLSESARNERTFLIFAILGTVFTVVLLLLVLVLRKRVHVVVKLFEESGRCIRRMPLLLLQPFWTFISLILFFVYWVAVLVALATAFYPVKSEVKNPLRLTSPPPMPANFTEMLSSIPSADEKLLNKPFTLVNFNDRSWIQYMWWYHVIALIWTSEFILGCQQMVIAGAVATWYFTRDKNQISCPIGKSAAHLFMYHMGSVALGSFLITIFKIPRLILTCMISQMRKYQEYKCVSWCLKCCTCCLWCMEKCIRYLNQNAYTIVAIQGYGFCHAAKEAFDILVSNAVQVAAINSVGDFILFLGKCSISAITAVVGLLIMKNDPDLHFYSIPVLLISVFSYFIAHSVLSIYEMVIDTLFLCCCEDILKNDGSKEKPYFGGSLVRYIKGGEGEQPLQPLNKETGHDLSETE